MPDPLEINAEIVIPREELRFTFVRSSGPGGQNVNKVNSKAVLRWEVASTESLPEGVRQRFVKLYPRRIGADGALMLTSQRYRDQGRNVADCLDKLRELVLTAVPVPTPRKKTRPSQAARRKRLEEKRQQGDKKRSRGNRPSLDD